MNLFLQYNKLKRLNKKKLRKRKKKEGGKKKKGKKAGDITKKTSQESKASSGKSLTKLDDLPTLGGFGQKKQQQYEKFDDGFDLDDISDSNAKDEDNQLNSFSKGQNLLKEVDEEASRGFNVKVPIKNNSQKSADVWDDGIEEEIEVEPIKDYPGGAIVDSGENPIAFSQSLGRDASVDSLALQEFDYIEGVD